MFVEGHYSFHIFFLFQGPYSFTMGNSASQTPTNPESAAIVRDPTPSPSLPPRPSPPQITTEVQQNTGSNGLSYQDSYKHYVRALSPPGGKHLVASTYTTNRSRPTSAMSTSGADNLDFTTSSDVHIIKSVPFRLSAALDIDSREDYGAYVGLVKPLNLTQYNYSFSLEQEVRDGRRH